MTEELSPEFLKFSQMLDEEPGSVDPKHTDDADLLQQLGEALRDEPGSGLPGDFASQTAQGVIARLEALGSWGKRMLWLESRLLSPLNVTRALKSLPVFGALGALAYLAPHWLLPFGLLLLSISTLWSIQHWVARDVWGLGKHDFRTAIFQRLTLTTPVLAAVGLLFNGGWEAGGALRSSLDFQSLTAGTLLLLSVPVLVWMSVGLRAVMAESSRPKLAFAVIQGGSLLLMAASVWQALPHSPMLSVTLGTALILSSLLLARLTAAFDPQYLRFQSSGFRVPSAVCKLLFYLLPMLSALGTGLLIGAMVHYLGFLSVTFSANSSTLSALSIFMVVSVTFLIVSASYRYWESVLASAQTRPFAGVFFQAVQVIWCTGIVSLLLAANPARVHRYSSMLSATGFLASVVALLAVVASRQPQLQFQAKLSLPAARKKGFQSILFGAVPIVLSAVVFFQINLTTEIYDSSYTYIVKDVKGWLAQQKAIPAEQNGWMVLKPYLLRPEVEMGEHQTVNKDFKVLGEFVPDSADDYPNFVKGERLRKYQEAKERFVSRLPLVERALSLPYFSSTATEGLTINSYVPDFIALRAITQGLTLLSQESLSHGDIEACLRYAMLGLKWDRAPESQSLIGLMIRIAQTKISIVALERPIVEGKFSDAQLQQLAQALRETRPPAELFADVMKRETYMCDTAFDLILNNKTDLGGLGGDAMMTLLVKILPRSYWESERKAYWNNQLSLSDNWHKLAFPPGGDKLEISPFNVASATLVPNIGKARVQYCYLYSHMTAMILQCELERYKIHHGSYPDTLNQLTPIYIKNIPEDFMQPQVRGMKGGFKYQKTSAGYLLKSKSPVYDTIGLKTEQVYGHDDHYDSNR